MTGVPHTEIEKVWGEAEPLVEKGLARSLGEWAASDIRAALLIQDMQLWAAFDNGHLVAVLVTQIITYPRKRVCDLIVCGGRGLKFWVSHIATIEAWAKFQGCHMTRFFGRRGWIRALGWTEAYTVAVKEIGQ